MGEFIDATPTAELLPLSAGVQDDESENEMGMTYEELSGKPHSIALLGSNFSDFGSVWSPSYQGQARPLVDVSSPVGRVGTQDAQRGCRQGDPFLLLLFVCSRPPSSNPDRNVLTVAA